MAVHRNFNSLAFALERTGEHVNGRLPLLRNKVATVAGRHVIDRTPVDTGQAISGWVGSVNERRIDAPGPHAPGRYGSTADTNRELAYNRLVADIRRAVKAEDKVIVQNNHPYIMDLNRGSSKQAPANFVQGAVRAGLSSIRGIRLLNKGRIHDA